MNRELKSMKAKTEHTRSSGNIFADLGLPDAVERMLKAQLAVQLRRFIGSFFSNLQSAILRWSALWKAL
jgi:hypothetical protein